MYFITREGNTILDIFNGNDDLVIRSTGEAATGSIRVPDGATPITDAEAELIFNLANNEGVRYTNGAVVTELLDNKSRRISFIIRKTRAERNQEERDRLLTLTDAEIAARVVELGGTNVS